MENYEDEEDTSYWEEPQYRHWSTDNPLTSGSLSSFRCPNCGSYNTISGVYFEQCNSCDWSTGY